jgi:hypothetical protein
MPYSFKAPTLTSMAKYISLMTRLFLLLAALALAASASGQDTLNARITITSQCNTQQALFGPQAEHNVTVICQPGMTPYQTESLSLNDSDTNADTNSDSEHDKTTGAQTPGQQAQSQGSSAAFNKPSSKKVLSPPLPGASTFASKVVFVIF